MEKRYPRTYINIHTYTHTYTYIYTQTECYKETKKGLFASECDSQLLQDSLRSYSTNK